MRTIGVAERRARLGVRHHLAVPAGSAIEVAHALVGLHSSDPVSVFLAVRARTNGVVPADLERALYDDRSMARILGMRRTMFVVPTELAPTIHAACTRVLAPRERRRTIRLLEEAGVAEDGAAWIDAVGEAVLGALAARGEATAAELTTDVPELGERIPFGEGTRWAGVQGMSTRMLFLLATTGRIVRARPQGTWTSTRYRWAILERWLGVDLESADTVDAQRDLAARWLRTFGPGTVDDLRWWSGWTLGATRRALAALETVEVDLDGQPGLVLAEDDAVSEPPDPWVALLPGLDPSVMGWRSRAWYLDDRHRERLFDRNGNAGPTVLVDGRVVGGWAQRPDGEIAVALLDDVGADARSLLAAETERLAGWIGDVRVAPRFRTPLERDLVGG